MSDQTNPPQGPEDGDDRVLAAEYALGLLSSEEHAAFEVRLTRDQALRDETAAWVETFASLTDDVEETTPSPQVRRRIEAQLFGQKRPSLWQQIWPYGLGGIAAALLLWISVTFGLIGPGDPVFETDFMAELAATPEGEGLVVRANLDSARGALEVLRSSGTPPEGRVFELWLIVGDNPPVSLGLLDGDGQTLIEVPQDVRPSLPGALLAVSDEPPGGSPTGAPTGAVRAAGPLTSS